MLHPVRPAFGRCFFSTALPVSLALFVLSGCASARVPVTPGTIPVQPVLTSEDEQFGQQVLGELLDTYPLDTDDSRINRVRAIVDRLADAARATYDPWHVYVLKDPSFKNAAATRGNFIFVWTGILSVARTDSELATILSHEMGHALAGHVMPDPAEEANRIISGVAGSVAREAIIYGGEYGALAGLAEALVTATLQALIVNPEVKKNELEADHIGFFILSDAGYDPGKAVEFWRRLKTDPEMGDKGLTFLSTHPSSAERVQQLEALLPEAMQRFRASKHYDPKRDDAKLIAEEKPRGKIFKTARETVKVYAQPDVGSEVLAEIPAGTRLVALEEQGRWVFVDFNNGGFVLAEDLRSDPPGGSGRGKD